MIRKLSSSGVKNLRSSSVGSESLDKVCSLAKHNGKDVKIVELKQFDKEEIFTSELRKLCLILVKRNIVRLVGSDVYLWQRKGLSQGWLISSQGWHEDQLQFIGRLTVTYVFLFPPLLAFYRQVKIGSEATIRNNNLRALSSIQSQPSARLFRKFTISFHSQC